MLTEATAKHVASTGANPDRRTNQPSASAPTNPPTWFMVPIKTAVEVEKPAVLAIVGSQPCRKYRLSKFMKYASQIRTVPVARPSWKSFQKLNPGLACSGTTNSRGCMVTRLGIDALAATPRFVSGLCP